MKERMKKHRKLLIVSAALLLAALVCLIAYARISTVLVSQREAERWQGDSSLEFGQISAFMPADEKLTLEQIYTFRNAMQTKFHEAALDINNDDQLFLDAWCCFDKVTVTNGRSKGEVYATAVGGNYFDFHPIKLLSGSYIMPDDLMKDRVLLDEETAWLLFGGTQLQGMSFKINGQSFVVAGVIEREDDRFTAKAYTSGMGIYMSYDAYALLNEKAGISCYEVVMPQPVKGFAYSVASEKFPIGGGEIVDNTGRYDVFRLLKMAMHLGSRAMQSKAIAYPYWENAARATEDWCAVLLAVATLLLALPVGYAVVAFVGLLVRGKGRLEEDIAPSLKEKAAEAIRIRQRRRWEKRHGISDGKE